jgi:hypothetical protein
LLDKVGRNPQQNFFELDRRGLGGDLHYFLSPTNQSSQIGPFR